MFKATITITADEASDKLTALVEQATQSVTDIIKKAGAVTMSTAKGAGTGGSLGQAITEAHRTHPEWTRKQLAEATGASLPRVAGVLRALGSTAAASAKKATPAKAAAKRAPAKRPEHANPADALDAALDTAKAS